MQPSVDKFLHDYDKRIDEPDGPPHIFGQAPAATPPVAAVPAAAAPTGGAQ